MYIIYRFSNPFQIFSLWFIPKIFLKFGKFQPHDSDKIYSYRKKECRSKVSFEGPLLSGFGFRVCRYFRWGRYTFGFAVTFGGAVILSGFNRKVNSAS